MAQPLLNSQLVWFVSHMLIEATSEYRPWTTAYHLKTSWRIRSARQHFKRYTPGKFCRIEFVWSIENKFLVLFFYSLLSLMLFIRNQLKLLMHFWHNVVMVFGEDAHWKSSDGFQRGRSLKTFYVRIISNYRIFEILSFHAFNKSIPLVKTIWVSL